MAKYCFTLDDLEFLFQEVWDHKYTPTEQTARVMLEAAPNGHVEDFTCSPGKAG